MREPSFTETMQLGIVVRDLEATVRRYEDDYGIGPWRFDRIDLGEANDYREYGEPVERSNRIDRWKENRDGKADRHHAGHRRRRHRPGRRVGAAGYRPRRVLLRASGEIQRAGAGPQDLRGSGGILADPVGQVG